MSSDMAEKKCPLCGSERLKPTTTGRTSTPVVVLGYILIALSIIGALVFFPMMWSILEYFGDREARGGEDVTAIDGLVFHYSLMAVAGVVLAALIGFAATAQKKIWRCESCYHYVDRA